MSWRCLAFLGTRQRWCLAGSDAAAHHTHFCAHCCYFSLPRHYRASYLLVPRKTSAIAAAAAPALVSGNLFLSPHCLWSAKKEPSCSAFHCWFLWEGLEKPQVGCLSFLWEKRSLFNWKKEKRKATRDFSLLSCPVWTEESQNLHAHHISSLSLLSRRSQSSKGSVSAYYSLQGYTWGEAHISGFSSLCRDSAVCYWAHSEEILSCLLKRFFSQTKESGSGQCHVYSCHVL